MSLRVCTECTTPFAHTLDACPHCGHSDYVWDHQLPDGWQYANETGRKELVTHTFNSLSAEDINDAVAPAPLERPKDSDSRAKWAEYAVTIQPDAIEEIGQMTKADLITTFG